jgi:predicted negative regulator of RcsB-dependent stress response
MAATSRVKRSRKMSPEVKAAYAQVEAGVRSLGKSIAEIQQGFRKAERKIEADARSRIRELRQEAKTQLAGLQSKQHEVAKTLRSLGTAAEGSWQDVKATADTVLAEAKTAAASVVERFRNALGR